MLIINPTNPSHQTGFEVIKDEDDEKGEEEVRSNKKIIIYRYSQFLSNKLRK